MSLNQNNSIVLFFEIFFILLPIDNNFLFNSKLNKHANLELISIKLKY
jgi:hypothetical protein